MKFEPIDYMIWAKLHSRTGIELSRSSIDPFPLQELELDFSDLKLTAYAGYGYPPLVDEIASRYRVSPDKVALAQGTSQGLFLVCAALLSQGDEVLVEKPAYQPLLSVPKAMGAKIKRIDRCFQDQFSLDPDQIKTLFSARTKLVILTNLHNPSGAYISSARMEHIARTAEQCGAYVLVDEVYLDFMQKGSAGSAIFSGDNVLVISSLTKVYGLGGLRCGWILGPADIIRKVKVVMDHIHVEGVHIGEQIGYHALRYLEKIAVSNQKKLADNRALLSDFIRYEPGLSWIEPTGGVVCFPRIEDAEISSKRLAGHLRTVHDTTIVPGDFFEYPRHFRLGFGVETLVLEEGLCRIGKALKELGSSV